MKSEPHVLVLLAVYNGEKWLREQLNSILEQQDVKVDILISLDNCTDTSAKICYEYADQFSNVSVLYPERRFGCAAHNFFHLFENANIASYSYVACSDQDDIWLSHKLDRAISSLDENTACCYSSDLTAFDTDTGKQWAVQKSNGVRKLDYLFQGASAGCTYVLNQEAALCVKKVLLKRPFEGIERPSHDWVIYAICRSNGYQWFFDTGFSGILYRQHDRNQYGSCSVFGNTIRKLKMIKSGWYKSQIILLGRVVRNTNDERAVISAIKTAGIKNRLWLLFHITYFRRELLARVGLGILISVRLI